MQMEDDEARLHEFLFSKLCDYSNVPHGDLLSESGVVNAVGSPLTISIVKCFKNKFRGSVLTVYIAVSLVESGQCSGGAAKQQYFSLPCPQSRCP